MPAKTINPGFDDPHRRAGLTAMTILDQVRDNCRGLSAREIAKAIGQFVDDPPGPGFQQQYLAALWRVLFEHARAEGLLDRQE